MALNVGLIMLLTIYVTDHTPSSQIPMFHLFGHSRTVLARIDNHLQIDTFPLKFLPTHF
jgi:hypothetical protein